MCEILVKTLTNTLSKRMKNVTYKSLQFFNTKQQEPKIPENLAREVLQNLLKINAFEALKLVTVHKKLSTSNIDLLQNNFDICKQNKIGKKLIISYPYVLSEKHLDNKINNNLKLLPLGLNSTLPLVQLPQKTLNSMRVNIKDFMNKLNVLSMKFQLSLDKTCEILAKRSFLISKPLNEIEELLDLYHKHGFTKEDILKDLWVLKYSKDFILNRLKFIEDQDIFVLKTWMLRCPEETLIKHIKRESENRVILGQNSLVQYLSEKLHCGENNAKMLIKKHPQLQHKSLSKLNLMIDLLCKQGFTKLQICKVPKILLHSTETTLQRLKQLISLGKTPNRLYILTKSQKLYGQYIENLIKSQKESTNN